MERRAFLRGTTMLGAGMATGTSTASATGRQGPLRVHIVLFDGVEEQDFAGPYEVLSAAKLMSHDGVQTRYVTTGEPGLIRAAYGTQVWVDHTWEPQSADLIIVPGGGYQRRDGPGIWAEIARGTLPSALAAAARTGLTISSLCTGAIVLGAAGLLKGRRCTTHHGARPDLEARGGIFTQARVVDDGDLVTAAGITSGLELGLWLARRELGADVALGLEGMLEYEARGTVWTR